MSQQFAAHFVSSRRPRRSSDSLMAIRQKEGESIRAFIFQFNTAALEVRDLDQSVAMAALKSGLQKNDLLFSLEKKHPRDFADMLARAESYVRAEEAFEAKDGEVGGKRLIGRLDRSTEERKRTEARPRSRTPPGRERARTPQARKRGSPDGRTRRGSQRRSFLRRRRFHNYTPLNTPKT
ncbi:putative Retrotransposon gag protein [Cocos nucifera]|uniref:Putative Retrotransposon gag protein n=1 Tax=Cocos nucifera TaxID=13894 RepID=A0A8K0HV39_COCNU|nr:putative Retrotransposon gag protein [Cocos nucifera]